MVGNNRKTHLKLFLVFVGVLIFGLLSYFFVLRSFFQNSSGAENQAVSQTMNKNNIAGDYVSSDGNSATITLENNQWKIEYQTSPDTKASATFKTEWRMEKNNQVSTTKMEKSDGYKDFTISIKIFSDKKEDKPVVTVTMSDGNPNHEMIFANTEKYFKTSKQESEDAILGGDLSAFAGTYSNDDLEKSIADSGFTLYGYVPEDYYQNKTSVFPNISKNKEANEWKFWSGASHANYKLNTAKLPQKINDYYEVYFVGANSIAIEEQEFILTLVPENVVGPDGITTKEKRLIYGLSNQISYRTYHDKWWERYQTVSENEKDLNIAAILSGDFSTLAGTWVNGEGAEIVINSDGTTNRGETLSINSTSNPKLPTLNIRSGNSGALLALFKKGFTNPYGDYSDSSKPRLVIGQNIGAVPEQSYFYRK
ncbi:hypothetical protein STRDD11_00917 [Streptococcus sp. DD11]|uniref:DUF6287 domain-containing protein n=1 Tax=Streptococcus sp. DD11 TaxID=1777879 RepID=UPI000791CF62|nr:DUF6287 domain-containing protein [Streptococcus sp. DD11]KXT84526.1 hypothetical protein STRDD11_00917 [Streptococcus sp. DD11]